MTDRFFSTQQLRGLCSLEPVDLPSLKPRHQQHPAVELDRAWEDSPSFPCTFHQLELRLGLTCYERGWQVQLCPPTERLSCSSLHHTARLCITWPHPPPRRGPNSSPATTALGNTQFPQPSVTAASCIVFGPSYLLAFAPLIPHTKSCLKHLQESPLSDSA